MNPVDDQIAMLQKVLPEAKHIGMLYCTAESNSQLQIEMAEAACDKAGLTTERFTVSSSNEIQSVVESMVGKVDAGYSPTDNTIAAAAAQVGQIAKEGKLPFTPARRTCAWAWASAPCPSTTRSLARWPARWPSRS